jgi:7-cyano-7-deazaguanine reductase
MNTPENSTLGKAVDYTSQYNPALLFAIPRSQARSEIGIGAELPFIGVDIWNAYELSWLDARGKPRVALAEFRVPAHSPNIIESKSLKLYLNSYMQTCIADAEALRVQIASDLSQCADAPVTVVIVSAASDQEIELGSFEGEIIDDLPITVDHFGPPNADYLKSDETQPVTERLVSHLLKSNCPVTGQPDWASVQIAYRGPRIDRAGLLRYLISFREHREFHEQCVERIFTDLIARCGCRNLAVYARYTRRGGLDINPFRATPGSVMPGNPRLPRQ